jgi:hypothetical protein
MIGNLEKHKFDVAVVRDIEHGMQLVDLLINH